MAAFTMSDGSGVLTGTGRVKWTNEATVYMLNLIRDLNVVSALDSRRQRNQNTFMVIESHLSRLGYDWSWQQIRCHWKNLKARYNHERRFAQKGQRSSWKHYGVMNALLRQRNSSGGRSATSQHLTGSSCAASYTENGGNPNITLLLLSNGSCGQDKDEYIVPTSRDSAQQPQNFSGVSAEPAAAASAALADVLPTASTTLNIKEEPTDEDAQQAEAASDIETAATPTTTEVTVDSNSAFEPQHSATISEDQAQNSSGTPPPVETILTEPDVPPLQTTGEFDAVAQNCPRYNPGPFYRSRKRIAYSWTVPSAAERKAKLEWDILVSTKRKLEAETLRAEAEERRAAAETLLLAETLKRCSEEKNKAVAETMFLVQERRRSEEETRKAAAIADFHVEERRKAAAKVDVLLEHRSYYAEQRKTEALKRRVLLLEVQKIRREMKLI